jgi:flagellar motility protein MotE (MotC chaperone)
LDHEGTGQVLENRPWLGPAVFRVLSDRERYAEKWTDKVAEAMTKMSDDDIAEYIEGVGSNQAFFMISELLG